MKKQYRPWAPEQAYLLPPSPLEWLPEGHLAFFVLEVVRELDLSAIEGAVQEKDPRGERPYAPRMMTSLVLYGYCTGVFSSRKIERATYEDVPFRVLAGGAHPHFTTVNGFRLAHRNALAGLFNQVLKLCARAGLKTLGHVSLDGSKVQANPLRCHASSTPRASISDHFPCAIGPPCAAASPTRSTRSGRPSPSNHRSHWRSDSSRSQETVESSTEDDPSRRTVASEVTPELGQGQGRFVVGRDARHGTCRVKSKYRELSGGERGARSGRGRT